MKNNDTNEHRVRQRRKEARPAELIAAALDLFVERGFAATKLVDVAARAGVSKGTLYLYFADKEVLFLEVIKQGLMPVVVEGEAMLGPHSGDSASLLRGLILRWWTLVNGTKLGGIPKLIISEAGNFPEVAQYFVENITRRVDALLGKVLQSGIEKGEFRKVDIASVIELVGAPILMRSIWECSMATSCRGGKADSERYIHTHIDLLLKGLSAGD